MEKITLWVLVLMMIVALGYYTFGFISDGGLGFISGGGTTDNTQKETNNRQDTELELLKSRVATLEKQKASYNNTIMEELVNQQDQYAEIIAYLMEFKGDYDLYKNNHGICHIDKSTCPWG